jgi:hypothetical protein
MNPVRLGNVATNDRSTWTLAFQPSVTVDVPWCEFHAALLGFNLVSVVKAGENQGRRLEHDFVVLFQCACGSPANGAAQPRVASSFQVKQGHPYGAVDLTSLLSG